jgi:hypothetical protein
MAASAAKPTPQARFDAFVMVCLPGENFRFKLNYLKLFNERFDSLARHVTVFARDKCGTLLPRDHAQTTT